MEHVTRTIYFNTLQSNMVRGGSYVPKAKTTLNEIYNVLPLDYPPPKQYPIMNAIAIGRGALGMSVGDDGKPDVLVGQHANTDAGLFDAMPFVLRTLDNDLPADRRSRYMMRQQVEFFGIQYWAYWLRRIDFSNAETQLFIKRKLPDGSTKVDTFVPDDSNLSPQPYDLSNTGVNLIKGVSSLSSTIIQLPLDTFDINEIRNASTIMRRASGKATITEMAIVTCAIKQVQVPGVNGTFLFNEAQAAQVATFVQTLYPMDFINQSFTDELELGISEPLFHLEGNIA